MYRKKEVVSFSWSRFGNSTFRRFSSAIHRTAEIMQQRSYEGKLKINVFEVYRVCLGVHRC